MRSACGDRAQERNALQPRLAQNTVADPYSIDGATRFGGDGHVNQGFGRRSARHQRASRQRQTESGFFLCHDGEHKPSPRLLSSTMFKLTSCFFFLACHSRENPLQPETARSSLEIGKTTSRILWRGT